MEKGGFMKKSIPLLVAAVLLMLAAEVLAKPLVSISTTAEKEVTVNKVTKKVAAKTIDPGDVIFFTINYINSGNEAASSVVLDDPIPMGASYILNSAYGEGADILFSIDGKNFNKPSLLIYEVKNRSGKVEKRTASPEEYSHIRWVIHKIDADARGNVGFQVRIKK
jgi:uncharacterized repeat protein (TIGR01451 family)